MRTLLKNAWLMDRQFNMDFSGLLIEGERIASVSGAEADAECVLDFSGCTIIPGLIDTNLSCCADEVPEKHLQISARSGVTSVRCDSRWESRGNSILRCRSSYRVKEETLKRNTLVPGLMQADGIHLDRQLLQRVSPETLRDFCGRYAQRGGWITAEAESLGDLQTLVDCGITELLNTPCFPIPEKLMNMMAAKGICITLSAEEPVSAVQQDNLRRFRNTGGMIALGSGPDGSPVSTRQILHLMEIGFSLQAAVCCATSNGAVVLGTSMEEGSIAAGNYADLIVIRGNPEQNPAALCRIVCIVRSGKVCWTD